MFVIKAVKNFNDMKNSDLLEENKYSKPSQLTVMRNRTNGLTDEGTNMYAKAKSFPRF